MLLAATRWLKQIALQRQLCVLRTFHLCRNLPCTVALRNVGGSKAVFVSYIGYIWVHEYDVQFFNLSNLDEGLDVLTVCRHAC